MATIDEEELRRILDEGEQQAELPPRTVMLPPQGADLGVDTSKFTSAAPAASPEPEDDMELAYARAADREARRTTNNQGATANLIAGFTGFRGTPAQPQAADAESKLLGARKARSQSDLKAMGFQLRQAEAARRAAETGQRTAETRNYRQSEAEWRRSQAEKADKERAVDNERAERGINASMANARAMQDMARTGMGIRLADAQREREKDARGKDLPASELSALSELPVAEKQVDQLGEAFKRLDMGGLKGRVGGAVTGALNLQGTDTAEYNAAALLAMQAAGKIVEGGKLAAGDEVKYRKMMPQPGDSPEVVNQKVAGMKGFLRDLAGRRAQAFKDARYNVPDSINPNATRPSTKPAPQSATEDEDAKALQWAKTHPDDPRAKKILQLHGAQ